MIFNGAPFTELPRNDLLDSYESRLLLMNPTADTNDAFSKTTSESVSTVCRKLLNNRPVINAEPMLLIQF